MAYCFITIPALDSIFPRLSLYLLASHVALVNGCLPQGEALIKAAITLLRDVPAVEGAHQHRYRPHVAAMMIADDC